LAPTCRDTQLRFPGKMGLVLSFSLANACRSISNSLAIGGIPVTHQYVPRVVCEVFVIAGDNLAPLALLRMAETAMLEGIGGSATGKIYAGF